MESMNEASSPPPYQSQTVASSNQSQRPVHVKLNSWEYKCASDRRSRAVLGKLILSERDVILLDQSTEYQQVHTRIQNELRSRHMANLTGVRFTGIYISDANFNSQHLQVTEANWEACRELLLNDETQTLRVGHCDGPPGWKWETARQAEQEEKRRLEQEKAKAEYEQKEKQRDRRCKCVMQ